MQSVAGYLLIPVVYMVGVQWSDCYQVGCLVADKFFGTMIRSLVNLYRPRLLHSLAVAISFPL